jgi:rod shape-determining protein MreC
LLIRRRIRENRPTVLFVALVVLSLVSLASGTQANVVSETVRTAVSMAAYPFWKALASVAGAADYVSGLLVSYDASRREAAALRGHVHEMVPRVADRAELAAENARLQEMLGFRMSEPRLAIQPARVVDQPAVPLAAPIIGRFDGTLIIDKGSLHGVEQSMCVITKDGIVGVVTEVKPTHSVVFTLHHPECKIGAMIKRTRVRGVVHGSGSDISHICRLEYMDFKDDVHVGDEVVTSGGSIYPSGIPIGVVMQTPSDGAILRTALIRPAADPFRVDEVYVVLRAQTPIDELTGEPPVVEFEGLGPETAGQPMPDERTLQERYAP